MFGLLKLIERNKRVDRVYEIIGKLDEKFLTQFKEFVEDPDIKAISEDMFIFHPLLMKIVSDQQKRIQELELTVKELKSNV